MKKIIIKKFFKSPFLKGDVRRTGGFKSGQVAIIVMLVSALLITVGLSLSKKTTVETKIDYNEEALKKAFNAAESGIDYFLATGQKDYISKDKLSKANVGVEDIGGGKTELNFDEFTLANGVQYFWLVDHDGNGGIGTQYYSGTFEVCPETNFQGSLEISQYYVNGGIYGVKRYGYKFSNNIVINQINDFNNRSGENCTPSIPAETNSLLVTVVPIFEGTKIHMTGSANFPVQGIRINSTGSAGVIFNPSGTEESTKINKNLVIERRYKFPYFLLSGIVSESSVLSHQD